MPPIDFFCWDCGAPFELTLDALRSDDVDPGCPICDSPRIGADYESLVRGFDACGCSQEPNGDTPALRDDRLTAVRRPAAAPGK